MGQSMGKAMVSHVDHQWHQLLHNIVPHMPLGVDAAALKEWSFPWSAVDSLMLVSISCKCWLYSYFLLELRDFGVWGFWVQFDRHRFESLNGQILYRCLLLFLRRSVRQSAEECRICGNMMQSAYLAPTRHGWQPEEPRFVYCNT